MAKTPRNGHKPKNLVVVQLSGGNDYLNTLVPYQDGHYVYQVVAGSGSGARAESPILYLADIENPSQLHVIFQP